MKELLGCIRRADKDFGLINDGDTVCVGVSGGKDSLALLYALNLYRRFSPAKFTLIAATLHLGREPFDTDAVRRLCKELGAKKLALGHHRDDAIETLMLSLLYEGRLHTFHPRTFLSRSGVTQIRPMVYCPEKHIIHVVRQLKLPVISSPCPANGYTKREEMKQILDDICKKIPNARELMLSALQNKEQYGLWD